MSRLTVAGYPLTSLQCFLGPAAGVLSPREGGRFYGAFVGRDIGYRSILVPLADNAETDQALDVASRLAAEHRASITAVAVIEVPASLPLDSHMFDEEAKARLLLRRAENIAESYGIHVVARVVRGREAGAMLAAEAAARHVDLVVSAPAAAGKALRPHGRNGAEALAVPRARDRAAGPGSSQPSSRLSPVARLTPMEIGTLRVKTGLAEMLKGGVIMDVTTAEQARIAEDAGACAVMALERVPADIRAQGGVARMADPDKIREIQEAVTIPVMAKARIGHFVEAQVLEALEVDYIDESEVLTPADTAHHIDKWNFTVPFVCGCTNLGEALRRIAEGAAMIRTKGEAGTGDIVNAVTHMRSVFGHIRRLQSLRDEELFAEAKELRAPYELVKWVAENGRLPVVTFTAGGIATPADAALCMQLGADGVFVGSGIFKSTNPDVRAKAIVEATTHFEDAEVLARVSQGLGDAMSGLSTASLAPEELLETRGW